MRRSLGPIWLCSILALSACAETAGDPCVEDSEQALLSALTATWSAPLTLAEVSFERVEPDRLIPGTVVRLIGDKLAGESGTLTEAELDGLFTPAVGAAAPLRAALPVEEGEDGELTIIVGPAFETAVGYAEGHFEGNLSLRVHVGLPPQPVAMSVAWSFDLLPSLAPDLFSFNFGDSAIFPGDAVPLTGDGFLLPGEGTTEVVIEGTFTADDGGATREYTGAAAIRGPVTVDADRRSGTFLLTTDVFPPTPGAIQDATVKLATTLSGGLRQEAPAPVLTSLRMNKPVISGFSPEAPSRGERVKVLGRGFLPEPSTLFQLDGKFHPDRGDPRDVTALLVPPDRWIDGSTVEMAMITETAADGSLTGLAAQPGCLRGTVTPILVTEASGQIEGQPWVDGFCVGPTKQMVWLRYLPTWVDTLEVLFGLGKVERDVRARVMEVARRDYGEFNVEFTEDRPQGFKEYSIIEVGGPDPNDLGLFGLDNTMGKDTGNVRLDDIVAGKNSESAGEGYPGFGGVFVESFVGFSPQADAPLPVANDRFDELFAPFRPGFPFCGEPVTAGEAVGQRRPGTDEAVRAFGSIVGNTVVHEIGHSLGLTQSVAGKTAFHNLGDNDNIMDAGTDRSFFERAELDGEGPSDWHAVNREYLNTILPKPSAQKP